MIKYIFAYIGNTGSGKSHLSEKHVQELTRAGQYTPEIYSFAHVLRLLISCTAIGNYSVEELKKGFVKKETITLNRDFEQITKNLEKAFYTERNDKLFGKYFTQKHTCADLVVDDFLNFYMENLVLIEQECKTIRDYLIYLGELFGKGLHNDDAFWAKILIKEIKTASTADVIIIDDLRFRKEFTTLKEFCKKENIVLTVYLIDNRSKIQKIFRKLPKDLQFISKQPETISIKNIF